MADIRLTHDQQQQLENLTTALGQDATLRQRLQAEPGTVFGEYGLSDLLPAGGQFDVIVSEPEVVGYAKPQPHIDYIVHRDVVTHLDEVTKPLQFGVPITRNPGTLG